jgi:hypothetical protein
MKIETCGRCFWARIGLTPPWNIARCAHYTKLITTKTARQRDSVLIAQANHYFDEHQWILAANYYAQTSARLEHVALKFIQAETMPLEATYSQSLVDQRALAQDALRAYLAQKLQTLQSSDATQRTLLATWLIELHLKRLNARFAVTSTGNDRLLQYREEFYAWLALYDVKVR